MSRTASVRSSRCLSKTPEEEAAGREATLKNDIVQLSTQLQALNEVKGVLEKQLVPIDRIKGELKKERLQHDGAQDRIRVLEGRSVELEARVQELEAELNTQKLEVDKYQARCLELESACAALGQQERSARAELFRAQEREQLSQAATVQGHIDLAEVENSRLEALSQVRGKEHQLNSLRADVAALGGLTAGAREELLQGRAELQTLKELYAQLQARHAELQKNFDVQTGALREAMGSVESLRIRTGALEAALESSQDFGRKMEERVKLSGDRAPPPAAAGDCLALHPERLAMRPIAVAALPGSVAAVAGGSGRNAMADRELPKLAGHLEREIAALPSRREYPRCAAGRQFRGRILAREHGPLFSDTLVAQS